MKPDQTNSIIMLISCPDRQGIVAAVTTFLSKHNGNIIHLDQHVDSEQNVFFMRVEWEETGFSIARDKIEGKFKSISDEFSMHYELRFSEIPPRMAILVSKESHCLYDVLSRVKSDEWHVEVPLIISNHTALESVARQFGIPFHLFPVTPDNKAEQEEKMLKLLDREHIDFVVLARYMQILTDAFVSRYPNNIINIHHSFLPAFPGAKPYHSAQARGVKIIGATSHYITRELDAGPIIEQDIIRVSHKDAVEDLVRKGKDLEKIVLSRAIWWHLQNKILVYNNKTVIFE